MGPFKKYVTCIMANFTTFNFVNFTLPPPLRHSLNLETIEREERKFFAYMAASAFQVISTEVENHIFKDN